VEYTYCSQAIQFVEDLVKKKKGES